MPSATSSTVSRPTRPTRSPRSIRSIRSPLYCCLAAGLAILAGGALAPAAEADWLMTREGARVETAGPWTVRGKLVVFKLADGTLSSLRAEQVDLAASEAATRQAALAQKLKAERERNPAATAPAKPRRKPIRVLTDKDFRQVKPVDAPAADSSTGGEAPAGEAGEGAANAANAAGEAGGAGVMAPGSGGLTIVDWNRVEESDFGGVELVGKVRNGSPETATAIDLVANFYDEAGTLIGKGSAELAEATLAPGTTTDFIVRVQGTYSFSTVKFQARSRGFQMRAPAPQGQDAPP